MNPNAQEPSAAQLAFAEFLERIEGGEECDFDAFCAERSTLTPMLRRIHAQWAAMQLAFERIGGDGPPADGTPVASPSAPGLDALFAGIGRGAGRLDRYVVGEEIARGGMGRILRAFDGQLRREVALKLQRGDVTDPRRRRRFLEEAQIAAQLDHPGIAPVHELGVDEAGRPFFSMQLVRGRDLGRILAESTAEDGEWSRPRVLGVLLRVCEAMAFAHERGVVHRDLKPQNVMVGRFGETYVMDWGLACVRGWTSEEAAGDLGMVNTVRRELAADPGSSELLTRDGDVIGTPSYMAPEQADGGADADPAVDVYAVGAMLYHVLAGHPPYGDKAADIGRVLDDLRAGPPPRLPDSAPAELRAICERAMARRPDERYPGMQQLADDLRAFLEVRTVRAYSSGRFAELRKWVARNRSLAIAATAFVSLLAVAAIVITVLWIEAVASQKVATGVSDRLRTELERRSFRSARQALQFQDSREAGDALWRAHLLGTMPRATSWALLELARRDPYLTTVPLGEDLRPVAFCRALAAVVVGASDGRVQLHEEDSLALRSTLLDPGPSIMSLCVLPRTTVAVCGGTDGVLRTVDLARGEVVRTAQGHRGSVRYLVAADDGGFASCGADGTVLWWSSVGAEPRRLFAMASGVTSLALRPDCDGVVAGDEHGDIRALALDGSWQVRYRTGARVTALAFGGHSNELWAGGTDHQVWRFDFVDGSRNTRQPTRNGTCRQLVRDLDGSLLAGGWWRIDRIVGDGRPTAPAALRGVSRWALDGERRRLVTSSAFGGLGLLDLDRCDRRSMSGGTSVALSANGRRLATVVDASVVVSDVDSGEEVCRLPRGTVGHLQLDGHGDLLAVTGGSPPRVRVFAIPESTLLLTVDGPADDPFGGTVAFDPGAREFATVYGSDRIVRRDRTGTVVGELRVPGTAIRIAYDGNGGQIAAIARDQNSVWLFDLALGTRKQLDFLAGLPNGDRASLSAVALSADGRRLAVGTWQGTVLVRTIDDPTAVTTAIAAHAGTIWSLGFDPRDPGLLITSGGAQGVACWDLDSGECCYQAVDDVALQVQISGDGRTMVCLVPEGVLLMDLSYRRRHIAGTLDHQLARLRADLDVPADREAELRTWAAEVMAEPWPRWR